MTFIVFVYLICAIIMGAGSLFFTQIPKWYRFVLAGGALAQLFLVLLALMFAN